MLLAEKYKVMCNMLMQPAGAVNLTEAEVTLPWVFIYALNLRERFDMFCLFRQELGEKKNQDRSNTNGLSVTTIKFNSSAHQVKHSSVHINAALRCQWRSTMCSRLVIIVLSGQKFEFVGPFMSKNHGSILSRACKRLFCILSKKKANILLQ